MGRKVIRGIKPIRTEDDDDDEDEDDEVEVDSDGKEIQTEPDSSNGCPPLRPRHQTARSRH